MAYIPAELRRAVIERANACCEYCLLHQNDGFRPHEIDHVIPVKHDGKTIKNNLCFSCHECNRYKGSNLSSIDPSTGEKTFLFDPRIDDWERHFQLDGARIVPLTPQGRATEFVLRLNALDRLAKRELLIQLSLYPMRISS